MNTYKASLFSCLFSVVAMAQVIASDDLTFMGQEERISGGGVSAVTPLFPGLSRDMKNLILGKYLDGKDRLKLRVVSRDAKAIVDGFGRLKLKCTMTTEQIIEFFKRSGAPVQHMDFSRLDLSCTDSVLAALKEFCPNINLSSGLNSA